MNIKEAIHRLVDEKLAIQVQLAKVVSVDETAMTCDATIDNLEVFDIRLRSVIDSQDKGVLVVPKLGSYVLVGLIDNKIESAFVCGFGEVDKVRIMCDDIEFNGGEFGGLVKSQEVANEVNELKDEINALKNIINTWLPVAADGGLALKTLLTTWLNPMSLALKENLENEKVTHG